MHIDCKTYLTATFDYFFDQEKLSDQDLAEVTGVVLDILIALQKEQNSRWSKGKESPSNG